MFTKETKIMFRIYQFIPNISRFQSNDLQNIGFKTYLSKMFREHRNNAYYVK